MKKFLGYNNGVVGVNLSIWSKDTFYKHGGIQSQVEEVRKCFFYNYQNI